MFHAPVPLPRRPAVLRAFLLPHPLAPVPESRVALVATFCVDPTIGIIRQLVTTQPLAFHGDVPICAYILPFQQDGRRGLWRKISEGARKVMAGGKKRGKAGDGAALLRGRRACRWRHRRRYGVGIGEQSKMDMASRGKWEAGRNRTHGLVMLNLYFSNMARVKRRR